MRGVFLTITASTSSEGQRKLVPRIEDHVSMLRDICFNRPPSGKNTQVNFLISIFLCLHVCVWSIQVILPVLSEYDVVMQVKACALSRIDTKV